MVMMVPGNRFKIILLSMVLIFTITSLGSLSCTASDQNLSQVLDNNFNGTTGYALWSIPDSSQARGLEMILQDDGKILVGGYLNITGQKDILVLRFNPDGTLDSKFGIDGMITYSGGAGKDDYGMGLALDSGGRILISGREHNGKDADMVILRYNPDGTPDITFGEDGIIRYPGQGSGTDSARGIVVDQEGKVIITGEMNTGSKKDMVAIRYLPEGILDENFGSSGLFILNPDEEGDSYGFALDLDTEERILITGSITKEDLTGIALVRLNSNGTPDSSFGSEGTVFYHGKNAGPCYGNWVSLTQDGKILVTGVETDENDSYDIVLLCYNPDGTPDITFGTEGVAVYSGSGYDYAWSHAFTDDGDIIIAGTYEKDGTETPVLIKYLSNGTPDAEFGDNGTISFGLIGSGPLYSVLNDENGSFLTSGYITDDGKDRLLLLKTRDL